MSLRGVNLPRMSDTKPARAGRPREKTPQSPRGKKLLAFLEAKYSTISEVSRLTGLHRGTIDRVIQSDDPSRQASATLDALLRLGVPAKLLGRAG